MPNIDEMYRSGKTLQQIANEIGRSTTWVWQQLDPALKSGGAEKTGQLADEIEMVREMRKKGMTLAQIAKQVGRSVGWVNSRANEQYRPRNSQG